MMPSEGRMKNFGISRRTFLQQFGLVSGSSLVFGAMDAWALTGQPAGPRPELPRLTRNARVLILGGGLSGLAVGLELTKLGYDIQVLEARSRLGGLAHTVRRGTTETELNGESQVCEFDEGMYLNAGPWRIPNSHTAVLDYCKELGVPLQIFINEHDNAILYYEGEEYGELAGRPVRLREVKSDIRGYTAELLAKAVNQEALDLPLAEEDVERLLAYLVGEGYLSTPDYVYSGGRARGNETPYDLTALLRSGFVGRVRSVDAPGNSRAPMFQPIGGMDQIPAAFGRALGDKVTQNAEVESVRQSETGVTVVYKDTKTGERRELAGDYVVCCLPMSVVKMLDVDLSPEMKTAVAGVNHSSAAKMGVQMRRRFWEEDLGIFGGASYTNLPLGQFSYPSNDFFAAKGVLLGFYGNGTMAQLNERPIAERIQHVIDNGSKFHPQMREEFETGYAAFWTNIKYSHGAYASNPGDLLPTLTQPDRRIYLGSAGAGSNPSWMEGAFSAAWGTVERLHSRVMSA
jgi:monoamine oxidase